ncbi:MAG: hypothetical protein ABIJ09_00560 [Pseudomonadota bacterium]
MMTSKRIPVLLVVPLLACTPALSPNVARDYLTPATPVAAGTPGSRLGQDVWQQLLGRVQVARPLCADLPCRRRELFGALQRAAEAGVRGALIPPEDSDLIDDQAAAELGVRLGLAVLPGERVPDLEVPAIAVVGFDGRTLAGTTGSWRERLQQASDEGAALILRHPCAQSEAQRALLADPGLLELLDAVEVDGPRQVDPACARSLWQGWLRQGHALVGLAAGEAWLGFDDEVLGHVNLVRTADTSAPGLLRALLAGRVQIVRSMARRPRLLLGADLDGDGRIDEARQGDRLTLLDDAVVIQIRVVGGRGSEVVLYTEVADGPVERLGVRESDQVLAVRYPVPAQGSGFIRAELYRDGDLLVISNPLFVTRARLRAPGP